MQFKHPGCGGHVNTRNGGCICQRCGDELKVRGNTPYYPEYLKSLDQWLGWRMECPECTARGELGEKDCPECGEEVTKIPINAETGSYGAATREKSWTDFETAALSDVDVDGLGFVFSEHDPVVGVDLDHCRDTETGQIEGWAMEIIADLDSFTEISVSGTGVHVYCLGQVPDGGNRNGNVEMYDENRFFAFTGHWFPGTPLKLNQRQYQIERIHSEHVGGGETVENESVDVDSSGGNYLSDDDVIAKATNANDGGKFKSLWQGSTAGYDSHSEARMALLTKLAFWTGGDTDQMKRLYEQSGLHPHPTKPGKWDRLEERELNHAVKVQDEFFGQ